MNVIGVGSTTLNDAISTFSSKGPGIDGRVKPDISAPGQDILSAYSSADHVVTMMSGTSMAAPHVTGMIALMLSADDSLGYAEIFTSMTLSSETNALVSSEMTCGGTPDTTFPNNIFGHGRINAYYTVSGQTVPTPARAPAPAPVSAPESTRAPSPIAEDSRAASPVEPSPAPESTRAPIAAPAPTPIAEDSKAARPVDPVIADDEACLYQSENFKGEKKCFSDKIDLCDGAHGGCWGPWNDKVRSVRLGRNVQIKVYQDDSFKHSLGTLSADAANFRWPQATSFTFYVVSH